MGQPLSSVTYFIHLSNQLIFSSVVPSVFGAGRRTRTHRPAAEPFEILVTVKTHGSGVMP